MSCLRTIDKRSDHSSVSLVLELLQEKLTTREKKIGLISKVSSKADHPGTARHIQLYGGSPKRLFVLL